MTTRIGFGVYDGGATRFSDSGEIWVFGDEGTWFIPSRSTQVFVYECGVLTEAEYHRIFGHDLPPLPMHVFCPDGWRSPLV